MTIKEAMEKENEFIYIVLEKKPDLKTEEKCMFKTNEKGETCLVSLENGFELSKKISFKDIEKIDIKDKSYLKNIFKKNGEILNRIEFANFRNNDPKYALQNINEDGILILKKDYLEKNQDDIEVKDLFETIRDGVDFIIEVDKDNFLLVEQNILDSKNYISSFKGSTEKILEHTLVNGEDFRIEYFNSLKNGDMNKTNFSSTHEEKYTTDEMALIIENKIYTANEYNIDIKVNKINEDTCAIIINPLKKEVSLEKYKELTTNLFSTVPSEIENKIEENKNFPKYINTIALSFDNKLDLFLLYINEMNNLQKFAERYVVRCDAEVVYALLSALDFDRTEFENIFKQTINGNTQNMKTSKERIDRIKLKDNYIIEELASYLVKHIQKNIKEDNNLVTFYMALNKLKEKENINKEIANSKKDNINQKR
jgi:hypothetical protein